MASTTWHGSSVAVRETRGAALGMKTPKFTSSRVGEERMKLSLGDAVHAGHIVAGWYLGCTTSRFLREECVLQKG